MSFFKLNQIDFFRNSEKNAKKKIETYLNNGKNEI